MDQLAIQFLELHLDQRHQEEIDVQFEAIINRLIIYNIFQKKKVILD